MAIACAVAAGVAAQAESNHADLAAELQAEIQKAQPDRYLLLLQACIDNAVKYAAEKKCKPEENPFHRLLVAWAGPEQPAQLRMAVVKALTSIVPGGSVYLDGVRMLFPWLGTDTEKFRTVLRDGLLAAVSSSPNEFTAQLEKLLTGTEASRTQVEDASYILWARDPARTVDCLIEGLAGREKSGRDAAAHHWVLADYLHHRAAGAEAWDKYWRENRGAMPALRETHFLRTRIIEEVLALWDECCQALRNSAGDEASVAAHWQFARRGIDSPWAAVRERACRELAALAAKAGPDPKKKALLEAQIPVLLDVFGAGAAPRYEPLAVRMEALRVLETLRPVAAGDQAVAKFLSDAVAKGAQERAFRIGALKAAGELGMEALRAPICRIVLKGMDEAGLDVLAAALSALGKIGFIADGLDVDLTHGLVDALFDLYAQEENRPGADAEAFRQVLVRTLGKIGGQTNRVDDVKTFLRKLLEKTLDKNPAMAVFVINAFGELSDKDLLADLSAVMAQRTKLSPNVVQAAVNAVWLIGSSKKPGALERAAGVYAAYLEAGDAAFSEALTQKVVFLCRGSVANAGIVASELARQKRYKSAVDILGGDDIAKLRQAVLLDGTEKEVENLWSTERVYLAALEALEQFDLCAAGIQKLETSKRAAEFAAFAGKDTLKLQAERVKSKKEFLAAVAGGKAAEIAAGFKALIKADASAASWGLGKIGESGIAAAVNDLLAKDPEVPEAVREKAAPNKK
ncbi:MAG TPA: hypothetical protein PLH78_04105 [Planctomycetota bacterium]|jgi:hypothetical protein|nr:MAG: hypothetical protein BWX69_00220 [Planctomycetes bacterium ADurb.Bin069]HQM59430.1 hypothetical protein [Planctomycetota bacterium]